ncbi:MAG: hypothetical protein AAF657_33840 [Acidobacteriota bacterium]
MTIRLRRRLVLRCMLVAIGGLVIAHTITQAFAFKLVDDDLYGIVPLFDLDEEANLPTLYSTLSLFFAAALLACIAGSEKDDRTRFALWAGLAAIFAFLAIDETAMLHEILGGLIQERFGLSGYLYYSWIVPYALILAGLFVCYLRFLLQLPTKVRLLILTAGAMFGAGVISLEAIAARHDELYGQETLTYAGLATAEELLEMGAIVVFVNALMLYLEMRSSTPQDGLRVTVSW